MKTAKPSHQILWLIFFSIAMGFLEASVVMYLREIYYPDGFSFPLKVMNQDIVVVELLREAATIIMLVGVAVLAGVNSNQRLSFFLFAFAIWDVFYYVFLKLFLDWPESWFTWDILFLIPVPWIGPVLSPILVCITMIVLAGVIYFRDKQNQTIAVNKKEWLLIVSGSLIIVISWMEDYFTVVSGKSVSSEETLLVLSSYVPERFDWWLFAIGEIITSLGIFLFWKRTQGRGL